MLTEGMCLLAGGSKIGKSWFALALSIAIANGGKIFKDIPVQQGKVIYVALEDNLRRLKERSLFLSDIIEGSDNLLFATDFPKLDAVGCQALENLLSEHPDCVLVIFDTLVRVEPEKSRQKSDYEAESHVLGEVQKLAARKGICILFLHHTRKEGNRTSNDPYQEFLGSTAIAAIADTIWILKRSGNNTNATLHIKGREMKEQQHILEFNLDECEWFIVEREAETRQLTELQLKILGCFTDDSLTLSPKEVFLQIQGETESVKEGTVRKNMTRMVERNILERPAEGAYKKAVSVSQNPENIVQLAIPVVTDAVSHSISNVPDEDWEDYLEMNGWDIETEGSPVAVADENDEWNEF